MHKGPNNQIKVRLRGWPHGEVRLCVFLDISGIT